METDTLSVENLVAHFLKEYTKGLVRGSTTDWEFRHCTIHNAAHKILDHRLDEAMEQAKAREAAQAAEEEKCDGCPGECSK